MATWGYGRASTAAQVGSPETQKAIIRDYCRRAGLELPDDHFFIDPATSGKVPIGERPAGSKLLANLKRGDSIVVARLDRLSRSITNFARILETIENMGVSLHICDIPGGALDPNNHIGRLLITILCAFADYERRLNSVRVQEGNAELRAEGHKFGPNARYGYKLRKQWSERLGKNINIEEPNPDEQRVIRKILELRVKGHTLGSIGSYLNHTAKIRSRRGEWWNEMMVLRVLRIGYKMIAEQEQNSAEWEALKPAYADEPEVDDDDMYEPSDELEDETEVGD